MREKDQDTVLAAACRITVETGGFRMAWIGLLDDGGRLRIAAHAGADAGALALIERLISEDPPAGCSFTTDGAAHRAPRHLRRHRRATRRPSRGAAEALRRSYRSLAALPLVSDGRPIGVFNIYAPTPTCSTSRKCGCSTTWPPTSRSRIEILRRDAERQQAEERFRLVVENIREVFWISSSVRRSCSSSARPTKPSGAAAATSSSRGRDTWLDTVHADDRARDRRGVPHPAAAPARPTRPTASSGPTARSAGSGARAFPVRSAGGELERIVGTAADITEQRQLEEQFRQAQKMESIGRLAGGIAHDFNNLLTVINGTAELAALDLPRDAPLRADLVQIRQAGDRAAALTRQLLALSRQQILKPAVINLTDRRARHAEHAAPADRRARRARVPCCRTRWGT